MANDFIQAQLLDVSQKIDRDELKAAATLLNALVKSAPNDARIHFVAASLAQKANNPTTSIESLERALDLAPTWVEAHIEHIKAISQQRHLQLALDAGTEALELCGDSLPLLEVCSAVAAQAENFSAQENFLERALALDSRRVDVLNALGVCARKLGNPARAEQHFNRARELAPGNVIAIASLAAIAQARGDVESAARDIALARQLAPDDAILAFNADLASGVTPPTMPDALVASLFDELAGEFDKHAVGQLSYVVPRRFSEIILERYPDRKFDLLDLGSGTGLVGVYLGRFQGALIGVELSSKMIAEAAKHGLYHRFHQVSLLDALAATPPDQYDVIAAADVFIYVGDLAAVITNAFKVLRPGGLFLFSCEKTESNEPDLVLRATQRYAHGENAIRDLCVAAGYSSVKIESLVLRTEAGLPVQGFVCHAERAR